MKKTVFAVALLCAVPSLVEAKTFKLGDSGAVASIAIPDAWGPSEIDDGVEATSPDKETYVAAEIVKATELEAAGDEEEKFFKKEKIVIKPETKKESKITINGLPAYDISWDATDKDGPTHISMTLIKITDNKLMMLTYWGSATGEKSNGKELDGIAKSITPLK